MKLKRIISVITALTLCTGITAVNFPADIDFSITASAAEIVASGTCGAETYEDGTSNLTWTLDSKGTLTIDGTGDMMDYFYDNYPWTDKKSDIKSVIINDGVTSIGDDAFYNCKNIKEVTFTENSSLNKIGCGAFLNCSSLESFKIPESVTIIDGLAFSGCKSLKSIKIPEKVTSMSYAFDNCSALEEVEFDENSNLTKLEMTTFQNDISLKSIKIPKSVTDIEFCVFENCASLENVIFDENSKLKSIGNNVFRYCPAELKINTYCPNTLENVLSKYSDNLYVHHDDVNYNVSGDTLGAKCGKCDNQFASVKLSVEDGKAKLTPDNWNEKMYGLAQQPTLKSAVYSGNPKACGTVTATFPFNGVSVTLSHTNPHDMTAHSEVPATCEQDGTREYWECDKCNKLYSDPYGRNEIDSPVSIKETGHRYSIKYTWTDNNGSYVCKAEAICANDSTHKIEETVTATVMKADASCDKDGLAVYTADFTNEVFANQKETDSIPAKGHTVVIDKAVAAACSHSGLTEGKHCSDCGAVIVKQNEVPALEHTVVIDEAAAPTCTDTGLTEGKHCSVCGEVLKAQQEVDEKGHKYGTAKYTWTKNEDGSYSCRGERVCRNDEKHTVTENAQVVCMKTGVTCTQSGFGIYTAEFENELFVSQTKIDMISAEGHSFKDGKCTVCGEADPDNTPAVTDTTPVTSNIAVTSTSTVVSTSNVPVSSETTGVSVSTTNVPVSTETTNTGVSTSTAPASTETTGTDVSTTTVPVSSETINTDDSTTTVPVSTETTGTDVSTTTAPAGTETTGTEVSTTAVPAGTETTGTDVSTTTVPVSTETTGTEVSTSTVPVSTETTGTGISTTTVPAGTETTGTVVSTTAVPAGTETTGTDVSTTAVPVSTETTGTSAVDTTTAPVTENTSVTETTDELPQTGNNAADSFAVILSALMLSASGVFLMMKYGIGRGKNKG